jgi:hypothetical protein
MMAMIALFAVLLQAHRVMNLGGTVTGNLRT